MPLDLVEAAALHHNPSRSVAKHFTPLTAVHVANALLYELKPDKQGFVAPQIDEAYLGELGLGEKLKFWREILAAPDGNATEFRSRSGQTAVFKKPAASEAKPAPHPAKAAHVSAPAAPAWAISRRRWLYTGLGAAAFLLLFWIGTDALLRRALEPSTETVAQATPNPPVAAAPAALPQNTPAGKPPEKEAEKPAPPAAIVVAAAPAASAAPAAPPPPSAKELAFAELQLQSIFFARGNSSAVISGYRVRARDRLPAGALVVDIGPASVTLEFDNERKTLALK